MEPAVDRRSLGPFSVAPIGFGAMRLTGPNVFGPPRDRREAVEVLREAVARGVNHIDTAQFYGPDIVNELIREALHPYPRDLILVSKVGARRDARDGVIADDEPHQLRRAIDLGVPWGQGFFLGHPAPLDDAGAHLTRTI
jgi:pyridoxine 4-dehydrogenase